jgi:hypothetical protein
MLLLSPETANGAAVLLSEAFDEFEALAAEVPALKLEEAEEADVTPTMGTSESMKAWAVCVHVSPPDPQPLIEHAAWHAGIWTNTSIIDAASTYAASESLPVFIKPSPATIVFEIMLYHQKIFK